MSDKSSMLLFGDLSIFGYPFAKDLVSVTRYGQEGVGGVGQALRIT